MAPSSGGAACAPQVWQKKSEAIRASYIEAKASDPARFERPIDLSWSIWMFGTEPIEASLERLARSGLEFAEIKGDRHEAASGIPLPRLRSALAGAGIAASGACGMFSPDCDLSSASAAVRERAASYIRREIADLAALGARYLIVVPGAVGRPVAVDPGELARSAATLRGCGDDFAAAGLIASVEPIRSAEVSIVHSVADAFAYIAAVGHPAVGHVNGDVYHMSLEESHVGEAILSCGDRLENLHLADTNRDALGRGMLDLDTAIMAAYLIGMNREGRFLTAEPLGPYPDPYVLSSGPCDAAVMDELVSSTVACFREREAIVRALV